MVMPKPEGSLYLVAELKAEICKSLERAIYERQRRKHYSTGIHSSNWDMVIDNGIRDNGQNGVVTAVISNLTISGFTSYDFDGLLVIVTDDKGDSIDVAQLDACHSQTLIVYIDWELEKQKSYTVGLVLNYQEWFNPPQETLPLTDIPEDDKVLAEAEV